MRGRWLAASLVLQAMACNGNKDDEAEVPGTGAVRPEDLDLIVNAEVPSKRSEVLAVGNEATNSILLFGGNDGPVVAQILNSVFRGDTWIFEPGTGWTEIDADPSPRKRGRYTMSVDEEGHRALMYGGRFRVADTQGDYTLFDDLWEFDFDARTWNLLHDGTGRGPSARYYPTSAYDAESGLFYVWGGAQNEDPLSIDVVKDLWAWDGDKWTEYEVTGTQPSTRTFLGSLHDTKRNRLIVFGGQSGDFISCSFNDIFALDLNTLEWSELHDGSGKAPETRFHPHMQYDAARDRYLVFGGHADIGAMNDIWSFDPNTNTWDRLSTQYDLLEQDPFSACDNISPVGCDLNDDGAIQGGEVTEVPKSFAVEDPTAPERRYRGMFVLMWDNLWLGQGVNIECSDHLDDTWRYDIESDTWYELIPAKSGESCIRRGDDCACMCI